MSTGELTLGEAARFAGVSQTTVRSWIHNIEGARKLEKGGYSIPQNSLMQFLAMRGKVGSGRSGASGKGSPQGAPLQTRGEDRLQTEVDYIRGELRDARAELKEVRAELKEAHAEIRRLEAELRAQLSGSVVGGVSRWIKSRLGP